MTLEDIAQRAFAGDYSGALEACRIQRVNTRKTHLGTYISGYCHYHLQNYDAAAESFDTALRLAPGDIDTMVYAVTAHHNAGRPVKALEIAVACMNAWPSDQTAGALERLLAAAMDCLTRMDASQQRANLAAQLMTRLEQTNAVFPVDHGVLSALAKGPELDKQRLRAALDRIEQPAYRLGKIMSVQDAVAKRLGQFELQSPPDDVQFASLTGSLWANTDEYDIIASYPGYVATLNDAIVSGQSGAVFTDDGAIISDSYADARYASEVNLRADEFVRTRLGDDAVFEIPEIQRDIPCAINLSGLASNHFGHWFSEYLPRLRHFCQLPDFDLLPILINDDMPGTHVDFLSAICDNPMIIVGRTEAVRVKTLYVAPTITFYPFDLRPGHKVPYEHQASWSGPAMQFLRDRVLARLGGADTTPDAEIYLSRQNSTWAKPKNEDSFVSAMKQRGIQPVFLEKQRFAEQIATIRSAKTIVAPIGSALNMLIFARPETRILVFTQQFSHNWGGWAGPLRQIGIHPHMAKMQQGSAGQKHTNIEMRTDILDAFLSGDLDSATSLDTEKPSFWRRLWARR
ncbi:glycosyltransferase 61 family protein [Tateyamaria sp. syn59]|uniref:glycosyltransferase 61 family protein n=1 Tax=Tateyamaria sp. syn59 TaxID=2576942 RepID=UPI0011BFBD5B|nr:glycosyltransferase 61 family protein [Tateyamaria sp. syn59]